MSKKTDIAVLQLLTKVREKREAIKETAKRPRWETSCTISLGADTAQGRINIQTVRDPQKLVEIAAFLLQRNKWITNGAALLRVPYDNKYMGYTLNQWLEDLHTRIDMLNVETQKKELDALNKRVDKLVTPEQRREMELVELQKLLD